MKRCIVLMILLSLLAPAAMAATVTISPTKINPGDTVTVDVKGIPDNARFSLSINAEFNANPGDELNFVARDLVIPFSLNGANINVYTKGTEWTTLSLEQKDGVHLSTGKDASGDSVVEISQSPGDISKGTYDLLTLKGEAAAKNVITKMTMTGKKKGVNDGQITFIFDGKGSITPTIDVSIDESGKTETPSSGGSTGGSSSPGSPGAPLFPSDPTTPALPTTTSADGRVSLTGADIKGAKILSSAVEGTLPTGWTTDGRTYSITPADRALDAVISFPAPNTTATIARLEDGAWSLIPSKIEGDRITAKVTRGGSYAVLVLAEVPTQMVTTPTTTAPATATPAAPTPLAPLIPVAACAILILVQGRKD